MKNCCTILESLFCLSGSRTLRTSCVCTRSTDCPFKITPYKFVSKILIEKDVMYHPVNCEQKVKGLKEKDVNKESNRRDAPPDVALEKRNLRMKVEGCVAGEINLGSSLSNRKKLEKNRSTCSGSKRQLVGGNIETKNKSSLRQ